MDDTALWTRKLEEHAARIRALLAIDAEVWFARQVRDRFIEAASTAERVDEDEVARMKEEAGAAADAAARALEAELGEAAWRHVEPPEDLAAPITAHPPVARAVGELEGRLGEFLEKWSLPGRPSYALPARFIEGENLVTLTRNLWKAARHVAEAEADAELRARRDARDERRKLWDDL